MLDSNGSSGLFYRWSQRFLGQNNQHTLNHSSMERVEHLSSQQVVMCAETPPPQLCKAVTTPITARSTRALQTLGHAVRRGTIEGEEAFLKVSKAFAEMDAENILLRRRLAKQDAAAKLGNAAKSAGKLTRFPQGQVYDQRYRALHGDELAARGEREMARDKEKAGKAAKKNTGKKRARSEKPWLEWTRMSCCRGECMVGIDTRIIQLHESEVTVRVAGASE